MNSSISNRQIVLARHVKGEATEDVFVMLEQPMPSPGPGEILIRNQLASVEPGLAGAITGEAYLVPALAIGDRISSFTVGVVLQSRSVKFKEGDLVHAYGGWQDYAVVEAEPARPLQTMPFLVDPRRAPVEVWMAMLSLSAFTAYIGMSIVAAPVPGETVVVSAAAGAVGSMASQFACIAGARVVGIARGSQKCLYLRDELRLDAAVDYRDPDFVENLSAVCSTGIDVYFENVGGAILDAVWPRLNNFARISLCGQVSQYQMRERPRGPNLFEATIKRLTLTGFMGLDAKYEHHFHRFQEETLAGILAGKIKQRIDIVDGLENAHHAWLGLFKGHNIGKRLIRIS